MDAKAQGTYPRSSTRSHVAARALKRPSPPFNWLDSLKASLNAGLTGLAVPPLAN